MAASKTITIRIDDNTASRLNYIQDYYSRNQPAMNTTELVKTAIFIACQTIERKNEVT